jgi:glutamyl-tRNA synthetase
MTHTLVKSRFGPSPTGLIHLGNARTALLSALYAKHFEGVFLLRIEDTDVERSSLEHADALMLDLRWLGLDWQEGPVWQSKREAVYQQYYDQLVNMGQAYPCFCSETELALMRKLQLSSGKPPRYAGTCRHLSPEQVQAKLDSGLKPTLRFRMPENMTIEFTDLVKGPQSFASNDIGDFIIRRAEGGPIFMYCNAIDDSLTEVSHVIRGDDHLANTPRQIVILQALNMRIPQYGHISLIFGQDGSPLSKRNGSRSLQELRELGYLPLAVMNYLARLGHYYESTELMSYAELGQHFKDSNLSKSPARYDEQQLRHWQKEALQKMPDETLWHLMPAAVHAMVPAKQHAAFIQLARPNILFPHEATHWAEVLCTEDIVYSEDALILLKETPKPVFQAALEALAMQKNDFASLSEHVKKIAGVKGKTLFQPLRVALTGDLHGPEMGKIVEFLGTEKMKKRFGYAAAL